MNNDTLAQRVARGVEWLDAHIPEWYMAIDSNTLDMGSCEKCIGGQLDGEYTTFLMNYNLQGKVAVNHGFDLLLSLNDMTIDFPELTAEWKRVIRERRA